MEEMVFHTPFGEWRVHQRAAAAGSGALCVGILGDYGALPAMDNEKLIPRGLADFMVNLGPPQNVLQDPNDAAPPTYVDAWAVGHP